MSKRKNEKARSLKCVDLFAGAGGFSLAAANVGIKVVAAIEINKFAAQTYRENLAQKFGVILYESDISSIDPQQISSKHFPSGSNCDLVLGGPPCQGFSVHRINSAGVKDPRNKLILRYFDFVHVLRPKVFLMENVPGILWGRHKEFVESFYKAAAKSGYTALQPVVLDARDYGLPQRRKRVFILGIRSDITLALEWPPKPTHRDPAGEKNEGKKLKPWRPSSDVFEKEIKVKDANNIHMNHSAALIEVFKSTPINGGSRNQSSRILSCHKEHSGHSDVYGRIDPLVSGPTMTTACVNPSKGRFVHPTEHHGITVRHAARFQSFPDWFSFKGGLMAAGEQIGNAVPVKLAEVLLKQISKALIAFQISNE